MHESPFGQPIDLDEAHQDNQRDLRALAARFGDRVVMVEGKLRVRR